MLTIVSGDTQAIQWQGNIEGELPDWFEIALNEICSPFTTGSIKFAGHLLYIGADNGLIKVMPGGWVLHKDSGEISYCDNETIINLLKEIIT